MDVQVPDKAVLNPSVFSQRERERYEKQSDQQLLGERLDLYSSEALTLSVGR